MKKRRCQRRYVREELTGRSCQREAVRKKLSGTKLSGRNCEVGAFRRELPEEAVNAMGSKQEFFVSLLFTKTSKYDKPADSLSQGILQL